MKRREFIAASCVAGLSPIGCAALAADDCKSNKEYYELRLYHFNSEAKRKAADEFFAKAAVPAWNRLGIGPVGVFQMLEGESQNLYVLLPHKSAGSIFSATDRLMADAQFLRDGAAFLDAPPDDPAYERIESTAMLAFDAVPKLELPGKKETRVFQLRIYESHGAKKGQKKVEMFNEGGEVAVFRDSGMPPVFMGQSMVGAKLPNLTYMLCFDDMDAKEAGWKRFFAHPGWLKLKADPAYKDTVSNITNILLRPAASSQM